jgi:hypothetical protein
MGPPPAITPIGSRRNNRLCRDVRPLLDHQRREPAYDQGHVDQAPERQLAQFGLDAFADENANERQGPFGANTYGFSPWNKPSKRKEYPTPKIKLGALRLRPKATWKSICCVGVTRYMPPELKSWLGPA